MKFIPFITCILMSFGVIAGETVDHDYKVYLENVPEGYEYVQCAGAQPIRELLVKEIQDRDSCLYSEIGPNQAIGDSATFIIVDIMKHRPYMHNGDWDHHNYRRMRRYIKREAFAILKKDTVPQEKREIQQSRKVKVYDQEGTHGVISNSTHKR